MLCVPIAFILAVGAVSVSQSSTVPRFGVFEETFTWKSGSYGNPWEQVRVNVVLTSPKGEKVTVGGFYCAPDTWKARFCPSEVGDWTWRAEITDGEKKGTFRGRFKVVESVEPGFVRQNPHNKVRWVFENGEPYYPIGIGDCVPKDGSPREIKTWGMDGEFRQPGTEGRVTDVDTQLEAYHDAGMNIFRWSVDNCSFGLYQKIDPGGNVYLEREGLWGDELVRVLREHGFRVYMAIFGFKPPFPDEAEDAAKMDAVKRYVKYVADRYGAHVDFWELMNEFPGSNDKMDDDWYKQVASYLRSVDPYKHPISTSWERPDIAEIDICSPHWYERENEFDSDFLTWHRFEDWKRAGKPVIVGEQGNERANWDERSGVRMRIRTWTTFFAEGALIFWNTSHAKDYRNDGAANLYLGPEERGYLKALNEFTRGFDPLATVAQVEVSPKTKVRGYALSGPKACAVYLHNYVDYTNPTTRVEIKIEPKFAGTATWIEPATGKVLKTDKLPSGPQTVKAPDFVVDLAMKMTP